MRSFELGFGLGSINKVFSTRRRQSLIDCVIKNGITHFDTAPLYGSGVAMAELSNFLTRNSAQEVTIAAKFGLSFERDQRATSWSVYAAKRFLGRFLPKSNLIYTDYSLAGYARTLHHYLSLFPNQRIRYFFFHEMPELGPASLLVDSLSLLKSEGLIENWGVAGEARNSAHIQQVIDRNGAIQTRDSVEGREADFVLNLGCKPVFTYGYLREYIDQGSGLADLMKFAESRTSGLLFSSSNKLRIEKFMEMF